MMGYYIEYSCISHIGKYRKMNQDNFACAGQYRELEDDVMRHPITGHVCTSCSTLFAVFDGLGGEECGEIASLLAAKRAAALAIRKKVDKALNSYCTGANEEICAYAAEHSISSMGTTAAILVFAPREIVLCNIGDSKIFRYSGGKSDQISYDHISISVYGTKPPLSQNLGIPPEELIIEPYVSRGMYKEGDIYLICSDGLADMVSVDEMNKIIQNTKFEAVTDKLLEKALINGGRDNVTLITCRVARKSIGSRKKIFR